MFCNECGEENRNDRKFCSNCGTALKDYTKPRENLLMPEDIENEQKIVKQKHHISKVYNISMIIIFILATTATVLSFIIKNNGSLIFGIISFVFFITFFILKGIKNKKIKVIEGNVKKTKK